MKWTILIFLFIILGCTTPTGDHLIIHTEGKDLTVTLEIPQTQAEMSKGLMYREHLEENHGMLFIFQEEGKHAFWMKNTLIPLDMIFIDENNVIVDILEAIPCENDPCPRYIPSEEALYVLEVNQGYSRENSVFIGDKLTFSFV